MHLIRLGNRGINLDLVSDWHYIPAAQPLIYLYFAAPDPEGGQISNSFLGTDAAALHAYLASRSVDVANVRPELPFSDPPEPLSEAAIERLQDLGYPAHRVLARTSGPLPDDATGSPAFRDWAAGRS